jgi:hypothetical protein
MLANRTQDACAPGLRSRKGRDVFVVIISSNDKDGGARISCSPEREAANRLSIQVFEIESGLRPAEDKEARAPY